MRLICLVFCWANLSIGQAQSGIDFSNRTFVRVNTLDELNSTDYYLICSTGMRESFWMLSSEKSTQATGNKLAAILCTENAPQKFVGAQEKCVWQLSLNPENTEISLVAANGNGGIRSSSTNDLILSTSSFTKWNLYANANGTFSFQSKERSNYYLSVRDQEDKVVFGVYSSATYETNECVLYRLADSLEELPGQVEPPSAECDITFEAEDKLATTSFGATDKSDYLLSDNTIAHDSRLTLLTYKPNGADQFFLLNPSGQYLQADLSYSDNEVGWTTVNGQLATTTTPAQFLVYLSDENRFSIESWSSAVEKNAVGIMLARVGTAPDSTLTSSGTKQLSGAWSATQLSEVDFNGISALDLTALTLPKTPKDFAYALDVKNIPIYVSEAQLSLVPGSWPFVVAGSSDGTYWLQSTIHLNDKSPLCFDRDISWQTSVRLIYDREAYRDGHWETICLPFAWRCTSAFDAAVMTGYSNGELIFETVTDIPAHKPAIIRYNGRKSDSSYPLVIDSTSSTALAMPEDNEAFLFPNYTDWHVTDTDKADIYFLTEDGLNFKKVASGSHLAPFRAYLRLSSSAQSVRVKILDPQIISSDKPTEIFTIDGRKVNHITQHGVYIINSKKVLF
ncbi:MAG: hypothetical protein IJ816_04160 [Alloprevotella sp.]|nr:hypothetical protein [Alloprevotella sp.]